jgi:oxygen-independent coproporphyrinogen-3 oxidase
MAGLYIHIPFCKQKCHYCNFFSVASLRNKKEMVLAIASEIKQQKSYLDNESLKTIYLGGGTPSLLNEDELNTLFDAIFSTFEVDKDVEITLEANPDDLHTEKADIIRRSKINRLSIGIQSFHDDDLVALNRVHSARQSLDAIKTMQDFGISNISIDLIYGIPGLTNEKWHRNLETVKQLQIPHLSAYALTVEAKTALDWLIKKGRMTPVNEEMSIAHFRYLQEYALENGYEHYEISNFCKPEMYSRHNTAYWSGEKYLGIGPSAHSFDQNSRRWNVSNNTKYIEGITNNNLFFEEEVLDTSKKYNEYILTNLRTRNGCNLNYIKEHFGKVYYNSFLANLKSSRYQHFFTLEDQLLVLTPEGMLFTDAITSELFFSEDTVL